ncbi:phospho-sugar mutase [Mycoplasmoides pneumoniae]|uniref:phospho-sugar mutase n=1 Tax=Mycoplasmoides pneumoniae TaxID=2104 RepID=UPI0013761261|nr:phospho-sugar mutase [Mycoplasmoides pneumoniae]QHR05035.1 phospho-sugar mutase [Mycoplasmoides pneumoniae]QHR09245.1 phospho-sugar mutase [Mycoplasmoides pneumoniae]
MNSNAYLEAQRWLSHPRVKPNLKEVITAMSAEEIEHFFSLKKPSFGTAGVRGKMAPGYHGMNVFSYAYLTQGYVNYIQSLNPTKKPLRFLVARDTRKHGALFNGIVCDVITSMGHVVYMFDNNEPTPTPLVSYVIKKYHFDGGVNVTASHNPKTDNGFKIYDGHGAQLLDFQTDQLIAMLPPVVTMLDFEPRGNNELLHFLDNEVVYKNYFDDLKESLVVDNDSFKNLPVVFTGLHGTSVKLLPRFLTYLGYSNIISVQPQNVFDANFANADHLNPESKDTWELARQYASNTKAKLMMAIDPDADRFAIAEWNPQTQDWHYFSGNESGVMVAYYKLKHKQFKRQPYIVTTVVSTDLVDKIAKKYGAFVKRTNVGFKFIGQTVNHFSKDNELVVAFEEAIGMMASDGLNREKDSFQAAAIMLEIARYCHNKGISLLEFYRGEIFGEFGDYYNWTVPHTIHGVNWKEKMEQVLHQLTTATIKEVVGHKITKIKNYVDINLVEYVLENGNWIKFRISGTEPKLKLYFNLSNGYLAALKHEAKKMHEFLVRLLNLDKA